MKSKIKVDQFYVADCVEFMRQVETNYIDLTVTSPPYDDLRDYRGYSFPFEEIASELFRITKEGGVVVWVVGDKINGGKSLTSFRQGIFFQEIGFSAHDVMIYQKKNTPFMRSNAYTNCYEFMFILGFSAHDVMIYQKKNTPFMRSNAYTNCYEFMFILSKGTPACFKTENSSKRF